MWRDIVIGTHHKALSRPIIVYFMVSARLRHRRAEKFVSFSRAMSSGLARSSWWNWLIDGWLLWPRASNWKYQIQLALPLLESDDPERSANDQMILIKSCLLGQIKISRLCSSLRFYRQQYAPRDRVATTAPIVRFIFAKAEIELLLYQSPADWITRRMTHKRNQVNWIERKFLNWSWLRNKIRENVLLWSEDDVMIVTSFFGRLNGRLIPPHGASDLCRFSG